MPISEPVNPIAVHIGAGVVQVFTELPLSGTLKHFEVQTSRELNGTYRGMSNRLFTGLDGFIYGFTLGTVAYMRIRAIDIDETVSDWVQVSRAELIEPTIPFRCRAPVGSLISAGALFTSRKNLDRLVGFRAVEDIQF